MLPGQRRTPPCTDGIFASEKNETMPFAAPKMSLEIGRAAWRERV